MTKLFYVLSAILAVVLTVLALWPKIDLEVARVFYVGGHHFIADTPLSVVGRYVAWAFPFVLCGLLMLAWALARAGIHAFRWAPGGRAILFLTLTLAIGPGILVNGIFKLVAHRPRPYSVTAFDGTEAFRPFDRFDGSCHHSCSFPSAEMSSATWTLAPASLVPPPWRGVALMGALAFAGATGLWRMAFGAHFLSDVSGAALLTILAIAACRASVLRDDDRP